MSTSNPGTNLQKGNSDEESSGTFVTLEQKDTGFSPKRNIEKDDVEPRQKIQKLDRDNCSNMELTMKQLFAVNRELEEHEFRNVADVLWEDHSPEIDGVIGNMIFLVETAQDISKLPSEQLVLYGKLLKKS